MKKERKLDPAEAARLVNEGWSIAAAARKLGVSDAALHNYWKAHPDEKPERIKTVGEIVKETNSMEEQEVSEVDKLRNEIAAQQEIIQDLELDKRTAENRIEELQDALGNMGAINAKLAAKQVESAGMTEQEKMDELIHHADRVNQECTALRARVHELETYIMHLENGEPTPEQERQDAETRAHIEQLEETNKRLLTEVDQTEVELEDTRRRLACLRTVKKILQQIPDTFKTSTEIALLTMIQEWPE